MRNTMAIILASVGAVAAAHGQDVPKKPAASPKQTAEARRRRVDFIEAAQLRTQNQWLIKHRSIGMDLLTSGDSQTQYLLLRREQSSEPEVHARWDDLIIIRAGTGAIALGDSLAGSRYRAPGERAGGTIVNSHQIVVRAGDVVRVPAAVPHAFIVSGDVPLEYLLVKHRRQDLPIRWFGEK